MKKLFQIFWIPGGIGIFGLMLVLDDQEEFVWRIVGGLIATVTAPFMLINALSILSLYGLERFGDLTSKVQGEAKK